MRILSTSPDICPRFFVITEGPIDKTLSELDPHFFSFCLVHFLPFLIASIGTVAPPSPGCHVLATILFNHVGFHTSIHLEGKILLRREKGWQLRPFAMFQEFSTSHSDVMVSRGVSVVVLMTFLVLFTDVVFGDM